MREATGCSMSVPQKKLLGFSSSGRMGFSSKSSTTSPLRAALLRDALEQELIVVRNAQLAGKALADLAAAASILPADGENEMLVHAGPFRVPANSTRFR